MKVGELYVELGVDADTPAAKEFQSALNSVSMESIALVAGLTAVSFKLRDMLEESMNAAVGFKLFRNQSGLSSQELQRWQIIAERANISTEAVTSSILALQRNIANIRLGRGNLMPFQLLGIDITDDPFLILTQIQEKLRGLDRAQALNIMEMFGISPEMINIMTLTNAQFKELANAQGLIFAEKHQENALKLKRNVVDLRLEFKALGRELINNVSPMLREDLELITQLSRAVKWLTDGIANLRYALPFINIVPSLRLGEKLGGEAEKIWGQASKFIQSKVDIHITGSDPKETAAEAKKRFTEYFNDYVDIADSQVNNERP